MLPPDRPHKVGVEVLVVVVGVAVVVEMGASTHPSEGV
jgi:hypothetical protein